MARYHSTGDPAIDLGILAASVGIVLLVHLGVRHWPKVVYCMAPKTTEFARVRYVHASAFSWSKRGEEEAHIHTASFQLENGRRIKMYITHEDYVMLRAGSEGYLTRKGGWFLGFEPGEKGEDVPNSGVLTHEIDE